MSDLSFLERNQLEKLFGMGSGYVLDFSNREFQEFIADSVSLDIDEARYDYESGSKANRLRRFFKVESNHIVGKLIKDLVTYASTFESTNEKLVTGCNRIVQRLLDGAAVPDIDAIQPNAVGQRFDSLARSVRDSINDNEPGLGLDRLHTYVVKFVRQICTSNGIHFTQKEPLHSIFGKYVKHLYSSDRLESKMTEKILKLSISTLDSFNDVRNNKSYAHDNEILNYHESLLIFNHICASIRFLNWIENPDDTVGDQSVENKFEDMPF